MRITMRQEEKHEMKHKSAQFIAMLLFIAILSASLLSCNKSGKYSTASQSQNVSKTNSGENQNLSSEQSKIEGKIVFKDKEFEKAARNALKKPNGDFFASEMSKITDLFLFKGEFRSIEDIKWSKQINIIFYRCDNRFIRVK